jgi:hypothetical protein
MANTTTFTASQKRDLLKTFREKATEMVELEYITSIIKEGLNTDIKIGDCVITTTTYDSSIFKCDKLTKTKNKKRWVIQDGRRVQEHYDEEEELPNPYTERVVLTSNAHRTPGMSVKGDGDEAYDEWRIKVRKVNLLGWDESKNFYPYSSQPIIFRQRNVDFRRDLEQSLRYWQDKARSNDAWITEEMRQEAIRHIPIVQRLMEIPPFRAYYDHKYGFLVKRDLMPTRIVFPHGISPFGSATAMLNAHAKAVDVQVSQMEAVASVRVPMTADTFREAVLQEAMKPERMEKLVEKHGIDGAELTFTATDEGRGKA